MRMLYSACVIFWLLCLTGAVPFQVEDRAQSRPQSGAGLLAADKSQSIGTSSRYIISFDPTTNVKVHLTQLKKVILANCNSDVQNAVTYVQPGSSPTLYGGTFDTKVLAFIKSSKGFQSAVEDRKILATPLITTSSPSFPSNKSATETSSSSISYREIHKFSPRAPATVQETAPWGLARLTQPDKLQGKQWTFPYTSTGSGVRVYVVDTGFSITHTDFNAQNIQPEITSSGMKTGFVKPVELPMRTEDTEHGTAVASVVAGKISGVAKGATIIPVRCGRMTQGGFETYDSWVMKGIDDAVEDFTSQPVKKGIIVMSMITDGVTYESVADGRYEDAFRNAISAGMHVVTSAGNEGKDVCADDVPVGDHFNVGASTINDGILGDPTPGQGKYGASNYGKCITIFAPGEGITVADAKDLKNTKLTSGTSMAAPIVAGVIAQILESRDLSPQDMKKYILGKAVADKLNLGSLATAASSTVNLLLQGEQAAGS